MASAIVAGGSGGGGGAVAGGAGDSRKLPHYQAVEDAAIAKCAIAKCAIAKKVNQTAPSRSAGADRHGHHGPDVARSELDNRVGRLRELDS